MKCHFVPVHKWPKHQKNLLELCQHFHTENMLLFGVFFLPRIANADLKASNLFGHRALPLAFDCVSSRSSFLPVHLFRVGWKPWPDQNLFRYSFYNKCQTALTPWSGTLVPTPCLTSKLGEVGCRSLLSQV